MRHAARGAQLRQLGAGAARHLERRTKRLGVDLFDELAQRLSVRRSLVGYEGSVSVFEAGLAGAWDVAILAIDRVRAERLDFTPPFVVLEGTYVIRTPSPCSTVLDLDRADIVSRSSRTRCSTRI